jgi:hypothetical protein
MSQQLPSLVAADILLAVGALLRVAAGENITL